MRSNEELSLVQPFVSNKKYEKNFLHKAILLWNDLSNTFKMIETVKLFKLRVKEEMKLNAINFPE